VYKSRSSSLCSFLHSLATSSLFGPRTNTRSPIMLWFTRRWVMVRYLGCASSAPLLH
jgi:hypothetical protein